MSQAVGNRPVPMVLEDVHWVDPTTAELLELTIQRLLYGPADRDDAPRVCPGLV